MTIRRTLLAPLAAALVAGPLGTTAAQASFVDAAPLATTVATATVAPPTNVVGVIDCTLGTFSVTWTASTWPDVTGYRVTAQFNKGPDQVTQLPPTAKSWGGTLDPASVIGKSAKVQLIVTTLTSYGWTADGQSKPLSC